MTRRSRRRSTATLSSEPGRRPALSGSGLLLLVLPFLLEVSPARVGAEEETRAPRPAAAYDREIEALGSEREGLSREHETLHHEVDVLSIREGLARRQYERSRLRRDAAARDAARLEKESAELEAAAA